jgi:hypothetical protein
MGVDYSGNLTVLSPRVIAGSESSVMGKRGGVDVGPSPFNGPLIYRLNCVRPVLWNSSLPLMQKRVSQIFLNMEKDELELCTMSKEVKKELIKDRLPVQTLIFLNNAGDSKACPLPLEDCLSHYKE